MARADLQVENNKKNRYSEAVLAGLFDPESSFNRNEAASECCVCHRNVALNVLDIIARGLQLIRLFYSRDILLYL